MSSGAGELETRYYVGLLRGGVRVSLTAGPGDPDKFPAAAWRPVTNEGFTYYQVSREVAEEWTAEQLPELGAGADPDWDMPPLPEGDT